MSREAVSALCRGVVDYAGTFPPAKLPLDEAAANFARYRAGADAWMLHRFVLAARDLDALAEIAPAGAGWPVSVVCRDLDDAARALAWGGDAFVIESLESTHAIDSELEVFVERALPVEDRALDELRAQGMMLKVRLGGASLPSTYEIARVLAACAHTGLALKATAGLHHAIRSRAHGFVNLLLAATLARTGGSTSTLESILDETDAAALDFAPGAIAWRGHRIDVSAIEEGRELFRSFGSCSFDEPVESLASLKAPA